jgi:hypothetical protein
MCVCVCVCVCVRARACVYVCVCVLEVRLLFLTLPSQGTTPQIFTPKFPVPALGPKQKRK